MSFGDGIASVCELVARKYGAFAGFCTFIAIVGGAITCGILVGQLDIEYTKWSVERQHPDQPPCSEPYVCDTFHNYVMHDLKQAWNGHP